jgi:hypothetical protein
VSGLHRQLPGRDDHRGADHFAGTWHNAKGGWGKVVLDVSTAKLHHGLLEAFALGILCNLTVCLAVWAAYSGRSTTDKILAVTMPIALFVATGFEHSVANMFLIPLGIIISDTAGPGFGPRPASRRRRIPGSHGRVSCSTTSCR